MESCSDYELLYLLRCGNQDAEKYLYKRYYKLIERWIIPYIRNSGFEFEDCRQIAVSFLPRALESYRDDLNASLMTFLRKVVIRRLINEIKFRKDGRFYQFTYISLDDWIDEYQETRLEEVVADPYQKYDPDKVLVIKETEEYYMGMIETRATDLEKKVVIYKSNGYSHQEIADILQISIKSVYNSLYRYHKKMIIIDELK